MNSTRAYDEFVQRIKDDIRRNGQAFISVDKVKWLNTVSKGIGSLCMIHKWSYERVKEESQIIRIFPNTRR